MDKPKILSEEPFLLYQSFIDDIFGKNEIRIKPDITNNIIGTLRYPNEYEKFKNNFKTRLIRLKSFFEKTPQYDELKNQVALIANDKNWKGAYAELTAYDIFSRADLPIELNKTLPVNVSFAQEMGNKETNEDGYVPDINLYFDVKILSDTIGTILKGIIKNAIASSKQQYSCNILTEYPLDDKEEKYSGDNRKKLFEELKDFLIENNTIKEDDRVLHSKIVEHLSYKIHWGGGINTSISSYNPYHHAFEDRNLIFKRYTKKFLKHEPFILVMVNFPWYNQKINSFIGFDKIYYRSLARRTFCEHLKDSELMKNIVPDFKGTETIFDVSKHLTGIIFIDDNIIKEDSYSCSVYLNPNAINRNNLIPDYLQNIVKGGDQRSIYDDLKYDNY